MFFIPNGDPYFSPGLSWRSKGYPGNPSAYIPTPIGVVSGRLVHAGMDATPSALDESPHGPRVGALRCAYPGLKYVTPLEFDNSANNFQLHPDLAKRD
jgi:hypothetical protein